MGRIKDGVTVTWESSSGKKKTTKTGRVLTFVPECTALSTEDKFFRRYSPTHAALPAGVTASRCRWRFSGWSTNARYLVEVPRPGSTPLYYAPLASVVEKANPDAERTT